MDIGHDACSSGAALHGEGASAAPGRRPHCRRRRPKSGLGFGAGRTRTWRPIGGRAGSPRPLSDALPVLPRAPLPWCRGSVRWIRSRALAARLSAAYARGFRRGPPRVAPQCHPATHEEEGQGAARPTAGPGFAGAGQSPGPAPAPGLQASRPGGRAVWSARGTAALALQLGKCRVSGKSSP